MITYQREKWADCVEEMRPLWQSHFDELALNQDRVSLACDEAKFAEGDNVGYLHLITARNDGELIGYHYGILMGHLHYKDSGVMCYTDAYYLRPEFRKGAIGLRFLLAVKESLKGLGVVKFYMSTKVHQDIGPLLRFIGMAHSDDLYTMML
jgi:hypothetical protein